MRTLTRFVLVAAMPFLLSGCLSLGNIQNRGATVDVAIGSLQNRATLINLVRASRGEPLYFIALGTVNAQASADFKVAAPGGNLGPGFSREVLNEFTFSNQGTVLDNSTLTSFQATADSTKDFYTGMMSPLGFDDINLLLRQGFPRELVFYLVIEKAKFTPLGADGTPNHAGAFILYNDPSSPDWPKFRTAIQGAIAAGASTEVPIIPKKDKTAPDTGGDQGGPPKNVVAEASGKTGIDFVLKSTVEAPKARLCFERSEATPEMQAEFNSLDKLPDSQKPIYCGWGRAADATQILAFGGQNYEVEITTRSVIGVFNYLGQFLDNPSLGDALLLGAVSGVGDAKLSGPIVLVAPQGVGCFTQVTYADRLYCVPDGAQAKTTRMIFSILSDLVATKQAPGDLPASSTVLLTP